MADPRYRVWARQEEFDSSLGVWVAQIRGLSGGGGGGGSTQVAVSSLTGKVTVDQISTVWQVQSNGNSTVFQGSSAWQVQVSNGNSSVFQASSAWQVQVSNGNSSVFQASSAWQVQVTNQARVTNSSAGDFLVTVSAGNSTVFQGGAPWSVSQVAGSTWSVRAQNSSAADLLATVTPVAGSTWNVRALNSSAADLQATVTPVSGSTWNVRPLQSSAADLQATVTPAAGSTWTVRALNSSAADLQGTFTLKQASTGNQTSVPSTTTVNTTLLAANANRLGALVYNDGPNDLWLSLTGATESTTVFSLKVNPNGYFETPFGYTGIIKGHFTSTAGGGAARITEFTP